MELQLLGENIRCLRPAVPRVPSLSHGATKPKGPYFWQKDVLPAGTALAIWIALSAVGWAVIFGLLHYIS